MKTKMYLGKGLQAMALLAGITAFTACSNDNYHYDPNYQKELYNATWAQKFGSIDQNQDWSVAEKATANMAIYGMDALSDYKLKLYTANPLTDTSAQLIACTTVKTDASGSAATSLSVDVKSGQTVFYACYEDKDNHRSVKPVGLIEGEIDAVFGKSATRAGALSSDDLVIPTVSDPTEQVNAKYAEAKELNAENAVENAEESPNYASVLKISAGATFEGNIAVLPSEGQWGRTLYVDGTWDLKNAEARLGGTGMIVVRDGGKIIVPAGAKLETANAGRIIVLKGGTIEGDGYVAFCNGTGDTYAYNAGTIKLGTLNNNGGRLFNYGTMEIGELDGPSGDYVGEHSYINHGKITVKNSPYGSNTANMRIYNACQFKSEQNFACFRISMSKTSYFEVGGNLMLSTSNDGTGDDSEILMSDGALLNVKGAVVLNDANLVGPTTGNAICQFGQIGGLGWPAENYTLGGDGKMSKGYVINNLKISVDNPDTNPVNYYSPSDYYKFTMLMMNGRQYNAYNEGSETLIAYTDAQVGNGNATLVNKGEVSIVIPEGDCTPGYEPEPTPEVVDIPQTFIFACEDLGSVDDYDFNDVVFSVGHVAGQEKIYVTALAAGGTLHSTVLYNGNTIGEIHALLGREGSTDMLNTTTITETGQVKEIAVAADWTLLNNYNKFTISVENGGNANIVEAPSKGEAPQMIIVPSEWEWPVERASITEAYPTFEKWVKDATADEWASNRVEGKTVKR